MLSRAFFRFITRPVLNNISIRVIWFFLCFVFSYTSETFGRAGDAYTRPETIKQTKKKPQRFISHPRDGVDRSISKTVNDDTRAF